MSILLILYKIVRSYCFPLWNFVLYIWSTDSIEYFIVTRKLDRSCFVLPIYDDSDVDDFEETDDSFVLIRYHIYTSTSNRVYYKVLRDIDTVSGSLINYLVSMHHFDSLEFSNCSFIDCQTSNEDECHHINMREFSLVSNELFFELFNEWLWMYYLNDDYLPHTVTTVIDTDVNILSLKDTMYIKLEKNTYVIMDDDYVEVGDKKND